MSRSTSLCLIGVVILACYVIPYGFLSQTASWTGAFLFWTLAGVAIIVLNAMATSGFKEDGE